MSSSERFDHKNEYTYGGVISHYGDVAKCPFCNHHVLGKWKRPDGKFVVKCEIHLCGAEGPPRANGSKAIEAWNKRRNNKTMTVGRL
ncbi:hypothetical protein BMS3Abin14_01503 [bacterium BMS3Abin14]|nr:hypothetical protein BMS3Abin14_01503 [bacterium BMS3Abin14]